MMFQSWCSTVRKYMIPVLEWAYFFMLILQMIYYTMMYTTADIVWENVGEGIFAVQFLIKYLIINPQNVLVIIVLLRYVFNEKHDLRILLAASVIGKCALYVFEKNGYPEMLIAFLFMLGAYGIPFRKIVKVYFAVCLTIFAGVIFAAQIGLLENWVYIVSDNPRRASFGFSYPTRFASYVFYLCLWYWYLRDKKLTYAEALLPLAGGVFVYYFCEARLSSILLLLLSPVMLVQTILFRKAKRAGKKFQMNKTFSLMLAGSMIWCAILITGLTMLYDADNKILYMLNQWLSSRLSLGKKGMDIFGFDLWGRWIKLVGNGGYLERNTVYFYLDSSFLQFTLQYGLVITAIILLLFWRGGLLARKNKEWVLLWVMAFAAMHGLAEPQVIRIEYSPLIFAAFAELGKRGIIRLPKKKRTVRK